MKNICSVFLLLLSQMSFAEDVYNIEKKFSVPYQADSASDSDPRQITEFNGSVFFIANDNDVEGVPGQDHLFRYTPENNELLLIKDTSGNALSSVSELKIFNQKLYLKQGNLTYSIDSQFNVQTEEADFVFNTQGSIALNGEVYFTADLGLGNELYLLKQNNTPELIKDLNPGVNSGVTSQLTVFQQQLYFAANNSTQSDLYKFEPQSKAITKITNFGESQAITSVIHSNNKIYFNSHSPEAKKIYEYDGSQTTEIYSEPYWEFNITAAPAINSLVLSANATGSTQHCRLADYRAYAIALLNLEDKSIKCIFAESSLDHQFTVDHKVVNNKIVIDKFISGGMFFADKRYLSVYDAADNSLTELYSVANVCERGGFERGCALSFAIINGNVYLSSEKGRSGIELAFISLTSQKVDIIDVNNFFVNSFKLNPIHANKNLLFLQPYVTEQERKSFARSHLVYDQFSPQIEPFKYETGSYIPDTAYLAGKVYLNKTGRYGSDFGIGIFSYNGNIYRLKTNLYGTNGARLEIEYQRERPQGASGYIELDVEKEGISSSLATTPNQLVGENYFFVLPYNNGTERLYSYNLVTEIVTLIDTFDIGQIASMFEVNGTGYLVKQSDNGSKLYRIDLEVITEVASDLSISAESRTQVYKDKVYLVATKANELTPSIYMLAPDMETSTNVISGQTNKVIQSFTVFDDKVFFIMLQSGNSSLLVYDEATSKTTELDLGEQLTNPLDLIRFSNGVYFQAQEGVEQNALYSLTIKNKYLFPQVDLSASIASGVQGYDYRSLLHFSDPDSNDLKAYVVEPNWLSYDETESALVGNPSDPEYQTGQQDVTLVIDDGELVTSFSYPLYVSGIINIASQQHMENGVFTQEYSHQVVLTRNVESHGTLQYTMTLTREDTGEAVDWLTIDATTGLISGEFPASDTQGLNLHLVISAQRGEAKDTEQTYIWLSQPSSTGGGDNTGGGNNTGGSTSGGGQTNSGGPESGSGGAMTFALLLLPLLLYRRRVLN